MTLAQRTKNEDVKVFSPLKGSSDGIYLGFKEI